MGLWQGDTERDLDANPLELDEFLLRFTAPLDEERGVFVRRMRP
jgi:hypothetical protein